MLTSKMRSQILHSFSCLMSRDHYCSRSSSTHFCHNQKNRRNVSGAAPTVSFFHSIPKKEKMIKILTTSLLVVLIAYIVFPLSINFDSEDLNGRVALVTGGSRGSGRGFVHGLLEARATVYVTGRTRGSLEETCRTSKRPDLCYTALCRTL